MADLPDARQLQSSTDRWMKWGTAVMAALVVVFPLYRIIEPQTRGDRAEAQAEHLAAQGEELYRATCAECHGIDGERGADAPTLNSAQFLLGTTNARITSLVSVGIPGTAMVAFSLDYGGALTSEQIHAIVAYLRSLEKDAPDLPDWREYVAE